MNRSLPGRDGQGAFQAEGTACTGAGRHKQARLAGRGWRYPTSLARPSRTLMDQFYCPLEHSYPSTAPEASAPLAPHLPPAAPLPGTAFRRLHWPHDSVPPPRTCLELPVPVVTTRRGHTAEAQRPGLTPAPPSACHLAWTGAGSWPHCGPGKAWTRSSPPRPQRAQLATRAAGTQCGLLGQNEGRVS